MKIQEEQLISDLMIAYKSARKNERSKESSLDFELFQESELFDLKNDILGHKYVPRSLTCFIVNHPVKREIFAPQFRDRVISHLIFNWIYPIYETLFIYDSYSCRLNKGVLFGINRIEHFARSVTQNYTKPAYCLNIDISGYFMNIDRTLLGKIIHEDLEKIRYKKYHKKVWNDTVDFELVYYLIDVILTRDPLKNLNTIGSEKEYEGLPHNKSLKYSPPGIGIIIGDVLSQLFSNIYMNRFDHMVKRTLKAKYYGRYVDDSCILHNSKEFLSSIIPEITEYLKNELHLTVNMKKTKIYSIQENLKFLGACIKKYRRYAINRTIKSFSQTVSFLKTYIKYNHSKQDLIKIQTILNSYLGHLSHYKTFKIKNKMLGQPSALDEYFYFDTDYNKVDIKPKYITPPRIKHW